MVGAASMTLAELIARENPVRHCQECGTQFTDGDFVDYYCKLCSTIDRREMGEVCQSCFAKWESGIGVYLLRYDSKGTVCAACGLTFGGGNFSKHRRFGACVSPLEMKAVVKDGIVVAAGSGEK